MQNEGIDVGEGMTNIVKPLQKIFSSPVDLLDKVEKDKNALELALANWRWIEIQDSLFNFSVGCYHLRDWVKAHHPNLKTKADDLLRQNEYVRACRDLCNASKHVELDTEGFPYKKYQRAIDDVEKSATDSTIASSVPPYRLKIRFKDGNSVKAEKVIEEAFEAWKKFFNENGIK